MVARVAIAGSIRNISRDLRQVQTTIVPRVTSWVLNDQMRSSRTRLVRRLNTSLGVQQKRLRRRIFAPKGGRARPQRLAATGLSLASVLPGRYFAKGRRGRGKGITFNLPSGAQELTSRAVTGGHFLAKLRNQRVPDVVRRAAAPYQDRGRRRKGPNQWTWLPIVKVNVDTSKVMIRDRERVLIGLARQFPRQLDRRLSRALRNKGIVVRSVFLSATP